MKKRELGKKEKNILKLLMMKEKLLPKLLKKLKVKLSETEEKKEKTMNLMKF